VISRQSGQLPRDYFFESRGRIGGPVFAMTTRITIKHQAGEEWLTGFVLL